ncbi:MAG: Pr6Pr family membrane protein [Sphingomonas bacterium]|nr:Pr6Pr family membrane protein [Sphingomonas bacterium]
MAMWADSQAEAQADVVQAGGAARGLAAVVAAVGWAALALQLVLISDKLGFGLGAWRFIGYLTILTNIGAATVASAVALGSTRRIGGARARLMAATSIALVGLTYTIALRSLWNPEGLQKLADFGLHDVMPLLFVTMWALAPHGSLDRKDFVWALAPPALYAAYALARGAIDGWYAYWFLDPGTQNASGLLLSIAVVIAAAGVIAAILIAIDRWKGR